MKKKLKKVLSSKKFWIGAIIVVLVLSWFVNGLRIKEFKVSFDKPAMIGRYIIERYSVQLGAYNSEGAKFFIQGSGIYPPDEICLKRGETKKFQSWNFTLSEDGNKLFIQRSFY